jgi:hypothetical protein
MRSGKVAFAEDFEGFGAACRVHVPWQMGVAELDMSRLHYQRHRDPVSASVLSLATANGDGCDALSNVSSECGSFQSDSSAFSGFSFTSSLIHWSRRQGFHCGPTSRSSSGAKRLKGAAKKRASEPHTPSRQVSLRRVQEGSVLSPSPPKRSTAAHPASKELDHMPSRSLNNTPPIRKEVVEAPARLRASTDFERHSGASPSRQAVGHLASADAPHPSTQNNAPAPARVSLSQSIARPSNETDPIPIQDLSQSLIVAGTPSVRKVIEVPAQLQTSSDGQHPQQTFSPAGAAPSLPIPVCRSASGHDKTGQSDATEALQPSASKETLPSLLAPTLYHPGQVAEHLGISRSVEGEPPTPDELALGLCCTTPERHISEPEQTKDEIVLEHASSSRGKLVDSSLESSVAFLQNELSNAQRLLRERHSVLKQLANASSQYLSSESKETGLLPTTAIEELALNDLAGTPVTSLPSDTARVEAPHRSASAALAAAPLNLDADSGLHAKATQGPATSGPAPVTSALGPAARRHLDLSGQLASAFNLAPSRAETRSSTVDTDCESAASAPTSIAVIALPSNGKGETQPRFLEPIGVRSVPTATQPHTKPRETLTQHFEPKRELDKSREKKPGSRCSWFRCFRRCRDSDSS